MTRNRGINTWLIRYYFIAIMFALAVLMIFYFSMTVRHQWAMMFVKPYPHGVEILKRREMVIDGLQYSSIKTAPPLGYIWSHMTGSLPKYYMVIDIKGYSPRRGQTEYGRAKITLYGNPETNDKTNYTLNWSKSGYSTDVFGLYDPDDIFAN